MRAGHAMVTAGSLSPGMVPGLDLRKWLIKKQQQQTSEIFPVAVVAATV